MDKVTILGCGVVGTALKAALMSNYEAGFKSDYR